MLLHGVDDSRDQGRAEAGEANDREHNEWVRAEGRVQGEVTQGRGGEVADGVGAPFAPDQTLGRDHTQDLVMPSL